MNWRSIINLLRRKLWHLLFFRILFGEQCHRKKMPFTRISPSSCIDYEENLLLEDDVFIGHFNYIDASSGVKIGAGTQITNFISIISHSTHRSVRVAARLSGTFLSPDTLSSDIRAPVVIGDHCFLGPHRTIEAGSSLGKGCLVASHSRVRGKYADFSILAGSPALVVGDTRVNDQEWLKNNPEYKIQYEAWASQVNEL